MLRRFMLGLAIACTMQVFTLAVAVVAHAGEVRLTDTIQAGILNEGAIDMVVYSVRRDSDLEVVATYADRNDDSGSHRLVMLMAPGDDLKLGLPGHREMLFRFVRDEQGILVQSAPVGRRLAENKP